MNNARNTLKFVLLLLISFVFLFFFSPFSWVDLFLNVVVKYAYYRGE